MALVVPTGPTPRYPRCRHSTEPVDIDELVTHFRCPACSRPYPLYQGEHPAKFWLLVAAELTIKIAALVATMARVLPRVPDMVWRRLVR